jgi:hypothetical protein
MCLFALGRSGLLGYSVVISMYRTLTLVLKTRYACWNCHRLCLEHCTVGETCFSCLSYLIDNCLCSFVVLRTRTHFILLRCLEL